jgi:arylsulfatase
MSKPCRGLVDVDIRDSVPDCEPILQPPFAFTDGAVDRVVVDVSGDDLVDHEKEVLAYLARD